MQNRFFDFVGQWKWCLLLLLLLTALFIDAATRSKQAEIFCYTLYVIIFGAAAVAANVRRVPLRLIYFILGAWWLLATLHKLAVIEAPNLPALLTIIIVAGTLFATFSELTSRSKTTLDLIFGAVFCYFLIAVSWGLFYEQLYNWYPSSFDLGKEEEVASVFLYFSLVTLTTLGYGDITPVSPICRLAAAVEAATGTLYIAVFVGRLVGRFDPRVRTN